MTSPIPLHNVKSSSIKALGHDPIHKTLALQWHTGATYHYANVTEQEYKALLAAKSIGGHVIRHVLSKKKHMKVNE